MSKKFLLVLIFSVCLGSLSAQTFFKNTQPNIEKYGYDAISNLDTVKILAIMVEFQYSKDATTTGNGIFDSIYTKDYGQTILDPLPHNKDYFEAHLQFAKNYYSKVSNGKLTVEYEVLPTVIKVSKNMKSYSPPIQSSDFSAMTELISEAWTLAGTQFPNFDFNKFNLFTIFHAGVGRDVIMPGSIGNERDLPSVYLGLNSLRNYLGASFDGFNVGNTKITNSIILPQTQNRELETFSGKYLVQLTFNGLLVSSIASFLGLPDLFDTKTGLSAIGKFGLMDGQSIFAYNGLYPPQPSAWEKIALGWETPIIIEKADGVFNLKTKEIASPLDTVIIKVPINESEYFLIENRRRDAKSNGSELTVWNNGSISKKIFDRDTTGYYSFLVDSVSGVVIDVDEFDWAIPGNGIVIWHIDEKIISEKWASNEINANKDLRGVDVEEADGIQDIGRQFQTIFGDIVVGEGSYEDFWFQKNDAKLYKNVFDDKSTPNTSSNSGGKSLVSFSEFSDSANVMSFRISFGDLSVKPLFNYSTNLTGELKELKVFTKAQTDYYAYRENDNVKIVSSKDKSVISLNNFSEKEFSLFNQGNNTFVVGVKGSIVNYFLMNDTIATFTHDYGEVFSSAPSIIKNISEQAKIYLGTESGKLLQIDLNTVSASFNGLLNSQSLSSQPIKSVSLNGNNFGVIAQRVLPNSENSSYEYYDNSGNSFTGVGEVIQFSSTKNNSGEDVIILLLNKNRFNIYVNGKLETTIDSKWGSVNSFGIGDLKNDGNNYIVFTANNNLIAMNINGVIADNFPFELNDANKFLNPIRIADFTGDSKAEVIAQVDNGNLYSVDGTSGKITKGFPIAIDVSTFHTGNFFEHENKSAFANFSQSGNLSSWIISDSRGSFYWNGNSGCNQNTNFVASASVASWINSFFPKNKAYNYPNPVYESETFIRYFISEDSKINIKIFDISGDLVDELIGNGRGGFDNEIPWNVKNIQSGIYLARIEAQSNSGKKESAIIKIAVVK